MQGCGATRLPCARPTGDVAHLGFSGVGQRLLQLGLQCDLLLPRDLPCWVLGHERLPWARGHGSHPAQPRTSRVTPDMVVWGQGGKGRMGMRLLLEGDLPRGDCAWG